MADELAEKRFNEVLDSAYFETVMSKLFEAYERFILAAVTTES